MQRSFTYIIEELPLVLEDGLATGLVSGTAEINYWNDEDWGVESIAIDADRLATKEELAAGSHRYISKTIQLERDSTIYRIIWDRLENHLRDDVQDAVNNQIDLDRECAEGDRADARRDSMMAGGW